MKIEQGLQSQDAVVARIEARKELPLDFQGEALVGFLDYEHVKRFLKEGVTEKEWQEDADELTRESVISTMSGYWSFAIEKVADHRGLSASRSVDKMRAWVWLLGEEAEVDWDNYQNYGAPILQQIGGRYGFEIPESNRFERMAQGLPCDDDCDGGCSR